MSTPLPRWSAEFQYLESSGLLTVDDYFILQRRSPDGFAFHLLAETVNRLLPPYLLYHEEYTSAQKLWIKLIDNSFTARGRVDRQHFKDLAVQSYPILASQLRLSEQPLAQRLPLRRSAPTRGREETRRESSRRERSRSPVHLGRGGPHAGAHLTSKPKQQQHTTSPNYKQPGDHTTEPPTRKQPPQQHTAQHHPTHHFSSSPPKPHATDSQQLLGPPPPYSGSASGSQGNNTKQEANAQQQVSPKPTNNTKPLQSSSSSSDSGADGTVSPPPNQRPIQLSILTHEQLRHTDSVEVTDRIEAATCNILRSYTRAPVDITSNVQRLRFNTFNL